MKIGNKSIALLAAMPLLTGSMTLQAASDGGLIPAEFGKLNLDLRLRYEDVDDDSAKDDADALTLRARLGYLTPDFSGFKAFAELESTAPLGDREYNDLRLNGGSDRAVYSVIADPDQNQLNRAWVSFSGFDNTLVKLGRQRIIFDNARFVGNVGWRQNEQTFDALTIKNTSLADTTITVGYIDDIQTILGTQVEAEVPMFNVKYTGLPFGSLTGYGYFIDYDADATADRDTIGLRFSGASKVSDAVKLLYTAEVAEQDIDTTAGSEDLGYYFLEAGVSVAGITAKISREVQDGNVAFGDSFKTPLGTNHKFNGWTDQFLGTPVDGLEDTFITLSTKVAGVKLVAVYHDYEAEDSSVDYGNEWNLLAVKKFGKKYKALIKYASYEQGDSTSGKADKDKLWVQVEAKF